MYDDDTTVYFRSPAENVNPTYFYEGYGLSGYQSYPSYDQNPFNRDSRRYDYGTQPATYTPSDYRQPQYAGFNNPNNGGYYGNGYPQGPADSRRNDTGGMLNSDLFRSQQQNYSRPIDSYQSSQRPIAPQAYNGSYPVNGFDNIYTRQGVPEKPTIDWASLGNRDRVEYGYGMGAYPASMYTGGSVFDGRREDDWLDMYKKNFGESQKL